ncbi:MAG: DNA-binding protein [Actinomycetota bacterium]|nr:DNA-binding protein [Actinomycetota bacterium]
MQSKQLHEENGQKTFVLIFDTGDEFMSGLTKFAKENGLSAASLTAIGAFSDVTLGYFDMQKKEYEKISMEEQVEVLSLVGDIAPKEDGEPQVHAHVVVGRFNGTTRGGHVLEAHVRPTLEVVLTESPAHLRRRTDDETGLALIDLQAERTEDA